MGVSCGKSQGFLNLTLVGSVILNGPCRNVGHWRLGITALTKLLPFKKLSLEGQLVGELGTFLNFIEMVEKFVRGLK